MGSKQLGSKFLKRSQICSHTPSALNAGAKRSGATCHMAMPQCCYLAKGAKRPSHTTNTIKFDRIPFDPCNSIKRFDLCPFYQQNSTYLQPPAEMEKYQRHVLYFESLYSFKSLFLQIETTALPTLPNFDAHFAEKKIRQNVPMLSRKWDSAKKAYTENFTAVA